MENKDRFYWIRLNTDFFNEDKIDFLLSQKNGCEYVVLYQMLCLKTANTAGKLQHNFGEIIVPFNVEKIVRDCKYFDFDTVTVALELFKKLGLIYVLEDGLLAITEHDKMVGSESASRDAIKKREQRAKKKLLDKKQDNAKDNVEDIVGDKEGTNCLIEYRDKRLEIRDKSIENNRESNINIYGAYANVKLSQLELQGLTKTYGNEMVSAYISRLDEYLETHKAKKYDNHYLVIKKWIDEDKAKRKHKKCIERVNPVYNQSSSSPPQLSPQEREKLIRELNEDFQRSMEEQV